MPEGETVAQVARLLRPHLVGQTLAAVQARRLDTSRLIGARVTACESTGKYLGLWSSLGIADPGPHRNPPCPPTKPSSTNWVSPWP